jgi:hypothetical protein
MTTSLDKTIRREVLIHEAPYTLMISPDGLRLTPKGHRKGVELSWSDLVSGDAALAVALNASLDSLASTPVPTESPAPPPRHSGKARERARKASAKPVAVQARNRKRP